MISDPVVIIDGISSKDVERVARVCADRYRNKSPTWSNQGEAAEMITQLWNLLYSRSFPSKQSLTKLAFTFKKALPAILTWAMWVAMLLFVLYQSGESRVP